MLRISLALSLPVWILLPRTLGQNAAPSGEVNSPDTFEVAAVKPSDPASQIAIRHSGERFATTNTSLAMLITWAYDIPDDRLFGKPKWLDSVRYDIAALGPRENTGVGWFQRMTQTLLATRFNLAIHRETRQLPMYALLIDGNGAKVHPIESAEAIGQNPFNMRGRGRLSGTQVNAAMLAKVLSGQLRRAVEDQTGLKGLFDFKLEWQPDLDQPAPSALPTGPSIFTALREQLGLKLESRKGSVEVIVIDHVDNAPTGN